MSDSTPPPGGGDQYPPPGGAPPPSPPPPPGYPPPGYQQPYPTQDAYGPPPGYGAAAPTDYIQIDTGETVKLASNGERALARLIDLAIYFAISILLNRIALSLLFSDDSMFSAGPVYVSSFLVLVVYGIYEVSMVNSSGQTLGKKALKSKIIDQRNGQIPDTTSAFKRFIFPFGLLWLCFIFGVVVFLSPFFDNSGRRQGWHDKWARTVVVSLK